MMHMMRWSRLGIYNATPDCARPMALAEKTQCDAIICIMDYCVNTLENG